MGKLTEYISYINGNYKIAQYNHYFNHFTVDQKAKNTRKLLKHPKMQKVIEILKMLLETNIKSANFLEGSIAGLDENDKSTRIKWGNELKEDKELISELKTAIEKLSG